jgi:V8-like Glu-specific endopeptidase
MISKLLDTVGTSPPAEVTALIKLMETAVQDDKYRQLVNDHLSTSPQFQERKILLETGHFSGMDLLQLIHACGDGKGTRLPVLTPLVSQLVDWGLVSDSGVALPNALVRYNWHKERIARFTALNILDNVLLGPSYVAQKYRQSVPAIFVKKGQDELTGTGFLASNKINGTKHVIVTAKHNVDPTEGITFSGFGSPDGVTYRALAEAWMLHPSVDLAAMPVECSEAPISIYPVGEARILARTITLGYPRIATAADTYVLAHGGELNAVVTGFDKQDYLIISNVVAPGNSGGPVLDESGTCIGMVVRSFETVHEGGVSSANAALPAAAIFNFLALVL